MRRIPQTFLLLPAFLAMAVALVCICNSTCRAETDSPAPSKTQATITGRVIYKPGSGPKWRFARYYVRDSKKGWLAEAVVVLKPKGRGRKIKNASPQTAVLDQKDFRFTPEILAIRSGDSVRFLNSDPRVHNVSASNAVYTFSLTLSGGAEQVMKFPRGLGVERPLDIGCKLHSTMRAWIYVFDHPYYQITASDGRFQIHAPPGEYRLTMKHPAGGFESSQSIRLAAGENRTLEIIATRKP